MEPIMAVWAMHIFTFITTTTSGKQVRKTNYLFVL